MWCVGEGLVCGWVWGYLLMHILSLLLSLRSLYNNNIGADGARAVGDALKNNTTLTALM